MSQSTDNDKVSAATWGKLACEILSTNWDAAMEEVQRVKESIDTKVWKRDQNIRRSGLLPCSALQCAIGAASTSHLADPLVLVSFLQL